MTIQLRVRGISPGVFPLSSKQPHHPSRFFEDRGDDDTFVGVVGGSSRLQSIPGEQSAGWSRGRGEAPQKMRASLAALRRGEAGFEPATFGLRAP